VAEAGLVEVEAEAAKVVARPEVVDSVEADSVAEEVKVLAVAVPVDPEVGLAAVAAATTALAWEVAEVAVATMALAATTVQVEVAAATMAPEAIMVLEVVAAATTAAPGEVDSGDLAVEVSVAVADRVGNLPRLVPGLPRTLRPSGSTQPSLVSSRLTEF